MKRLEFLDSLRGIAALYVVIFHTALLSVPKPEVAEWVKPAVLFGHSGVILFFVISGFSLCLTMPRHERTRLPSVSYYCSRFFRIAPLFYLLLVYWCISNLILVGLVGAPTPKQVAAHVAFLFNLKPGLQQSIVAAGWTIGVEMLFYLLFPLAYAYFGTLRKKLILLAATIATYLAFKFAGQFLDVDREIFAEYNKYTVLRYLPIFVCGMIAFDVFSEMHNQKNIRLLGTLLVATSLAGLAALAFNQDASYGPLDRKHIDGIFCGMLVVGSGLSPWRLLVNGLTGFLGKISYSIYLWHPPVILALGPIYRWIDMLAGTSIFIFPLYVLVTLIVVLCVATVSYKVIEVPGINLGHKAFSRFSEKWTARTRLSSVSG